MSWVRQSWKDWQTRWVLRRESVRGVPVSWGPLRKSVWESV
ncbi:hypothetical protein HMPREF9057_02757 [Actinomyces sp. oral taxon 171 str. F0337]|nr:hypothetical protein HMPREF9057_02757 [Actinomyces sp. oral taxon 171 str. F0337]